MYSSLIIKGFGVFLIIILAGCSSGAGGEAVRGSAGSAEWFGSASQSNINAHYQEICKGYNFPSRSLVNNCIEDEIAEAKKRAGIEK